MSKPTIRDTVLQTIRGSGSGTNASLASVLNIPEPSIRRVTQQLVDSNHLYIQDRAAGGAKVFAPVV